MAREKNHYFDEDFQRKLSFLYGASTRLFYNVIVDNTEACTDRILLLVWNTSRDWFDDFFIQVFHEFSKMVRREHFTDEEILEIEKNSDRNNPTPIIVAAAVYNRGKTVAERMLVS